MKKFLTYILILIASIGILGLVPLKQARADNYEPLGTCTFDVGPAIHWTQNTCYDNDPSGTDWNEDTGTCILQNWSYKSCVTDKMPNPGAFVGANTNPTTNGQCTFSNWTDTSCHQNGPGAFTPVFSGTTPLAGALPVGTCSVTHISTSGCQKVSGTPSSTLTDTVTAGSGGTCSVAATQAKCATYGGDFWNTIGGSWGGVPVATWYGPGVTPATPGTVAQQNITSYTLLAPLPDTKGGQLTTLDVSGTNSLGMYLNLMMNIFIGICAVLAVIMILMGGIEYMSSELISSKEAGKERIRNALLGLLLALGAWTLLNTINPNLLNTSFSSLTSVAADAQLGGESSLPYVPIAQSALQSAGLTCPGGGGASALTSTAESFIGHSNYSNKARNTMTGSVANVDCSSFVDQVYTCSGLTPPGNTTADIFSTCTPATAATIQTGPSGTTVNGTALKVGDLLGWKAGQGGQSSGHVIMYVGNGNIIDSQQGVAVSQRPLDAKMMSMIQCVKPLGQ